MLPVGTKQKLLTSPSHRSATNNFLDVSFHYFDFVLIVFFVIDNVIVCKSR